VSGEVKFQVSLISVDNPWTTLLVKIGQSRGNQYLGDSYLISLHPPEPHGKTIINLDHVALPANLNGLAHMEEGPKASSRLIKLIRRVTKNVWMKFDSLSSLKFVSH